MSPLTLLVIHIAALFLVGFAIVHVSILILNLIVCAFDTKRDLEDASKVCLGLMVMTFVGWIFSLTLPL